MDVLYIDASGSKTNIKQGKMNFYQKILQNLAEVVNTIYQMQINHWLRHILGFCVSRQTMYKQSYFFLTCLPVNVHLSHVIPRIEVFPGGIQDRWKGKHQQPCTRQAKTTDLKSNIYYSA